MWTRYDLKMNAKKAFHRNYWACVLISLLGGILGGEMTGNFGNARVTVNNIQHTDPSAYGTYSAYSYNSPQSFGIGEIVFTTTIVAIFLIIAVVAVLYVTLIGNVISVGSSRYFMENREHKTSIGQLFYGFRNRRYWNVVKTMFFRDLFLFLWTLLFIIPGVIKSYSYRMVPYLLSENPNMDRKRAIELSRQMMDGHKLEAFILDWSFLGWAFLTVFTCGILGIFYVNPYVKATDAELYAAIRAESMQRGLIAEGELLGYGAEMI